MNETASKALFDEDVGKITERLLTSRSWILYGRGFPVLDVGFRGEGRIELRLRFVVTNWNDDPPSIILLDANGDFLPPNKVPQRPGSVFNQGGHPSTSRPFVCMVGSREYHTHPNHTSDSWNNYKNQDAFTLGGIMTQLWNAWLKTTP
jgi:hypothetical protein